MAGRCASWPASSEDAGSIHSPEEVRASRRSLGSSSLAGARRGGDQPPLRRVERVLRVVLGPSMTYTCACFPTVDVDARGGPGAQVRPGVPQARAAAGYAAARRRLWLGRHGASRRPPLRRQRSASRSEIGSCWIARSGAHRHDRATPAGLDCPRPRAGCTDRSTAERSDGGSATGKHAGCTSVNFL